MNDVKWLSNEQTTTAARLPCCLALLTWGNMQCTRNRRNARNAATFSGYHCHWATQPRSHAATVWSYWQSKWLTASLAHRRSITHSMNFTAIYVLAVGVVGVVGGFWLYVLLPAAWMYYGVVVAFEVLMSLAGRHCTVDTNAEFENIFFVCLLFLLLFLLFLHFHFICIPFSIHLSFAFISINWDHFICTENFIASSWTCARHIFISFLLIFIYFISLFSLFFCRFMLFAAVSNLQIYFIKFYSLAR